MADASETIVTELEVVLEAAEKKGDLETTNGGEEVIPQKVEEPAPEGSAETSGDQAVEEVEGESKPEDVPQDVLAAETVVAAVPEAKTEEKAAVETILEVKKEDEPVKEVEANDLEEGSMRMDSEARILEEEAAEAVPEGVIKEPKEVGEAENETPTRDAVEEAIEDKSVVEEAVKEVKPTETDAKDESEAGSDAKASVAEAEATDAVKPEKKQSRNVLSRMKRSFSKVVKRVFAGKLTGSKTADSGAKAEENAD